MSDAKDRARLDAGVRKPREPRRTGWGRLVFPPTLRVLVATSVLAGASLVVLAAGPAAATTVSNEATLRTAFGNAAETRIDLSADITLSACPNGFVGRNSATALVVDGHGHTVTQTCATGTSNVFIQDGTGALTFQNITITGGSAGGGLGLGGGISAFNTGVTLTNATVSGNTAGSAGGAFYARGAVTLTDSTVSDNTAGDEGGGIAAEGSSVTLTRSTVSNNTAGGDGGGIMDFGGGAVALTNSTVSNNASGDPGGGISAGPVTLVYATVVENSAPTGAANVAGNPTAFGSVVARPLGGGSNCQGTTTSNGFNFSDDTSCAFTDPTDDQNAANDPMLDALGNNGGPTRTRLPHTGSPLIDGVPTASCQDDGASGITTDQRGLPRPARNGCDVGAVEVAPPPPSPPVCPAATQSAAIGAGTLAGSERIVVGAPLGLQLLLHRRRARGLGRPGSRRRSHRGRARSVMTWLLIVSAAIAVLAACQPVKPTPPMC